MPRKNGFSLYTLGVLLVFQRLHNEMVEANNMIASRVALSVCNQYRTFTNTGELQPPTKSESEVEGYAPCGAYKTPNCDEEGTCKPSLLGCVDGSNSFDEKQEPRCDYNNKVCVPGCWWWRCHDCDEYEGDGDGKCAGDHLTENGKQCECKKVNHCIQTYYKAIGGKGRRIVRECAPPNKDPPRGLLNRCQKFKEGGQEYTRCWCRGDTKSPEPSPDHCNDCFTDVGDKWDAPTKKTGNKFRCAWMLSDGECWCQGCPQCRDGEELYCEKRPDTEAVLPPCEECPDTCFDCKEGFFPACRPKTE